MAVTRDIRVKSEYLAKVLAGEANLLMDGAMGTQIQARGLHGVHEVPDLLNLSHPKDIVAIHRAYVEAGAHCITANTFSANRLKLSGTGTSVAQVFEAGVACAREAGALLVAADLGPTGKLLEPLGTLSFDEAYDNFAEQARAAEDAGCDLILVETMTDLLEAKAAVLAAVETTALPVFATMTFDENGRTFLGTSPAIAASTLSALGASAVGVNCGLGPASVAPLVAAMAPYARGLLMAQPNAGIPELRDGATVYNLNPTEFAQAFEAILASGATVIGGCCGTTPAFIAALRKLMDARPCRGDAETLTATSPGFSVCSSTVMAEISGESPGPLVVGERINPTGRPSLGEALMAGNFDPVEAEAEAQQAAGVAILDINIGMPGTDEVAIMKAAVKAVQAVASVPLCLDSSNPDVLEAAARTYAGRPLLNSVNGKQESLRSVLPIAARYGCAVVALTLDERGIPPTAEGRLAIAETIVAAAEAAGVPRKDVAIDCLVMTAATNQDEVREVLRAITLIKERLGCATLLGVSNVSYGLPQRDLVNATFLAAALGAGLDLAIINPLNPRYRETIAAFRLLNGADSGGRAFIEAFTQAAPPADSRTPAPPEAPAAPATPATPASPNDLISIGLAGRAQLFAETTARLLETHEPIAIINDQFIPLLDEVGRRYEAGTFFLPQLMASAEAVKAGFDVIREAFPAAQSQTVASAPIVLATVEGDIHDIGKNIVAMLLENYGFPVVDLGKNVSPQTVVDEARRTGAALVGLSALMTTTVPAMERTVALIREQLPGVAVMVGGAVVTADYAAKIGADFYAKDAAASARIAQTLFKTAR